MRVCVALGLLAVGLRVVLLALGCGELSVFALTPCRLDGLCTGAWFALAARGSERGALLERAPRWIVEVAAAVVTCSALHLISTRGDVALLPLRGYLLAILFGLVIFAVSSGDALARSRAFLRGAWLRWLGKYSYGLYVFHGVIAYGMHRHGVVERLSRALGSHLAGSAAAVGLGMAASIAVSVTSYELLERRLLELKKWFEYEVPRVSLELGAVPALRPSHAGRANSPRAIFTRSKNSSV
jgi:peptidoglycan/LPS O-acetylase OafA/YrhL